MKLLKNPKNLVVLCLFGAILFSSCGAQMPSVPDTVPPSPDIFGEEAPTTEPAPEKDETADPDETRRILDAETLLYYDMLSTERTDYLAVKTASDFYAEATSADGAIRLDTVEEKLGIPHYKFDTPDRWNEAGIYIYIAEDGTVLEVGFERLDVVRKVFTGNIDSYLMRIADFWNPDVIIPCDPAEIYQALYDELLTHEYMHFSDRTDYPKMEDFKKVDTWITGPKNSVEDMISLLGQPHFTQTEEKVYPGSSLGRLETHIYVFDNGVVMVVCAAPGYPYIGDAPMLDLAEAMDMLSWRLRY
ncbi:MAG: hypothetical protein E7616_05445 [Ruminococcaceae bacterium]|nr:hypothetical protein [Oscillospiraceae bacterium]